jgi:hypothetical protein
MSAVEIALRVLVFMVGAVAVILTLSSALRTVVLPRAVPSRLTRFVFTAVRGLYEVRIGRGATYERRDEIMASYGPTSLLALLLAWVVIIMAGYLAMYWALGHTGYDAFRLTGSSVFTLGFDAPTNVPTTLLVISEAMLGLVVLALLITYLPTLYSAFQRRESLVTKLEVRAGMPPSGIEMLERFNRLKGLDSHIVAELFQQWENWFVDIEESHTSLPALNFFRSPQPQRSWITAAGAVLDGASLYASTLDLHLGGPFGHDPQADLCIRAGYLALRQISSFFRLPFNPAPQPGDPISIAREEFDAAYDRLKAAGLPVVEDRDAAWRGFSGWRVNYDDQLLALAQLVSAPYAPWSSDRGTLRRPSPLRAILGR